MIYKATNDDVHTLAELAVMMWSSHSVEELEKRFEAAVNSDKAAVYIALSDGVSIGFAQCTLRYDYVEGTSSSPVGYLEGIFVKREHRKRGYAGELLDQCEKWAESKGCSEFASDCELSNDTSLNFHLNSGFKEAGRIICFTKSLI